MGVIQITTIPKKLEAFKWEGDLEALRQVIPQAKSWTADEENELLIQVHERLYYVARDEYIIWEKGKLHTGNFEVVGPLTFSKNYIEVAEEAESHRPEAPQPDKVSIIAQHQNEVLEVEYGNAIFLVDLKLTGKGAEKNRELFSGQVFPHIVEMLNRGKQYKAVLNKLVTWVQSFPTYDETTRSCILGWIQEAIENPGSKLRLDPSPYVRPLKMIPDSDTWESATVLVWNSRQYSNYADAQAARAVQTAYNCSYGYSALMDRLEGYVHAMKIAATPDTVLRARVQLDNGDVYEGVLDAGILA